MQQVKGLVRLLTIPVLFFSANGYWYFWQTKNWGLLAALSAVFLFVNIAPRGFVKRPPTFRLRMCDSGCELLVLFLTTAVLSVLYHIVIAFFLFPQQWTVWVFSALTAVCVETVVFWNGIIRVYGTSVQLGIRLRVIGILCGWIPIANLVALCMIIGTASREVAFETKKVELDRARASYQVCGTRYPLLLVHGVFFRDFKFPNYWGRIPAELEKNGAVLYYGNHESASSVADSGAQLTARIKEIVQATGCGKVNVIAHSKGGLDIRYAVGCLDAAPYVASITTVNTPHRGCLFVDELLQKFSVKTQQMIAGGYNAALKKLGDKHPDFLTAVGDLTAAGCRRLGEQMGEDLPRDIYCQSIGSKLNRAVNGKFPLNVSYWIAKHYSGANDGLVSADSFRWGEDYTFLTVNGKRGISHGDMIDLNRENIPEFDVREFYVQLVARLKTKGL